MTPNATKKAAFDGLLAAGTLKCAILGTAHTSNPDSQEFFSDVNGNEVSGINYTAGGVTATTVSSTVNNTTDKGIIDIDDVVFSNIAVTGMRYACFYIDTGNASTSRILRIVDLGADTDRSGQDLELTINAGGLIEMS